MARIPAEELQRMLDAGEEVVIIDVRGGLPDGDEPIPGAMRIPLSEMRRGTKRFRAIAT